jgi:hypothetical protein
MAGVIATYLTDSDNLATGAKGPIRHARAELVELQAKSDPTLASPYLKASGVCTIPARAGTCTSGNLTITVNFPKYNVAVTTGNIAFDAEQADIQTAIDTALDGETILSAYTAGDLDVALTGNLDDTGNACVITANGDSINGVYFTIATNNVNLGTANLSTPAVTTPGTMNRPAEAFLYHFGVMGPASSIKPQGLIAADTDYELLNEGNINPHSLSPGLLDIVLRDLAIEQPSVADVARAKIACV